MGPPAIGPRSVGPRPHPPPSRRRPRPRAHRVVGAVASSLLVVLGLVSIGFGARRLTALGRGGTERPPRGVDPPALADGPPASGADAAEPVVEAAPVRRLGARGPSASRATAPVATFAGGVDAIFVERQDLWWLVDDGVSRRSVPPWTLDPDDARALGPRDARRTRDAIERGEGGGYADRTGLGPPPAPRPDEFAGISLVGAARDVATVLWSDDFAREHVVVATRLSESDDRADDASLPDAGVARRVPARTSAMRSRAPSDAADALERARRCALDGDASEALRLAGLAGARDPAAGPAPLAVIAAQALGRLGRHRESADCLRRIADESDDPEVARAVLGLEALARARGDDPDGALCAREDAADVGPQTRRASGAPGTTPDGSLDGSLEQALGRLPGLVRAGRAAEAVADVARALRRAGSDARSPRRRRAVLAAAAIALDGGSLDVARELLARGSAPPLAPDLANVVLRLEAAVARSAVDAARGSGKRPRGG